MSFLLFCGTDDWIEGGAQDLEGAYETEKQARRAFDESEENDWDWADILLVYGLKTKIVSTFRESRGWRDAT